MLVWTSRETYDPNTTSTAYEVLADGVPVTVRVTEEAAEDQTHPSIVAMAESKIRASTPPPREVWIKTTDFERAKVRPVSPDSRGVQQELERYFIDPRSDILRVGMSGPGCANLKIALNELGYRRWNREDDTYDSGLAEAVLDFQTARAHPNKDGQVGSGTRGLLVGALVDARFDFGRLHKVFDYDVALSFAGEDRPHAEALAASLKAQGIRVFYDAYEDLWGEDLYVHLHEIYNRRARFCVLFVSAHYAAKLWTNHELRAAQERALEQKSAAYILPVRIDETTIPGLHKTLGYVKLSEGVETIAKRLVAKVKRAPTHTK